MTTLKFKGKYFLTGKVLCITGLHVGGSTTGVEIGGIDNPVIKDPITDEPFIPGSSLKGKLRAMTEWQLGLVAQHVKHHSYTAYACEELNVDLAQAVDKDIWKRAFILARLFGASTDTPEVRRRSGPSRLIVRDARLTRRAIDELALVLGEGVFTEVKTENALDRVTAEANPRPLERVPAGASFSFEMLMDIYSDDDRELFKTLFTAMHLVEQSSLGGAGSRGSGEVKFTDLALIWRPVSYYRTGAKTDEKKVALPATELPALMALDVNTLPG